jgi:hypothetical protein
MTLETTPTVRRCGGTDFAYPRGGAATATRLAAAIALRLWSGVKAATSIPAPIPELASTSMARRRKLRFDLKIITSSRRERPASWSISGPVDWFGITKKSYLSGRRCNRFVSIFSEDNHDQKPLFNAFAGKASLSGRRRRKCCRSAARMATYLAQLASRDSETLTEISGCRAGHAGIGGQLAPGCRI